MGFGSSLPWDRQECDHLWNQFWTNLDGQRPELTTAWCWGSEMVLESSPLLGKPTEIWVVSSFDIYIIYMGI